MMVRLDNTDVRELTRRVGMDDTLLLSRYVETGCQDSFEQIVTRHSGWVYSLSLRAVRDQHLAEDVTQAVFLILARKAKSIRPGTPLSGWLFKASRFAVSDALKRRTRMKNRENRFAEFFKATAGENGATVDPADTICEGMSQALDEAVACLSDTDRQAVLLRFYEGKSLAEVGAILGVSEEAAKKRVARSVERLRKYFASRGVVASTAILLLLLAHRSAEAAAVGAVMPTAAAGAAVARAIADGALQLMSRAQARLLGAIFAGAAAVLVALPTLGGAIIDIVTSPAPRVVSAAPEQTARPLPKTPVESIELPAHKLPSDNRIADLWIGYKGQLLWRSDAYTDRNPLPFFLRSADKQDKPYAVAVDPKGNFFIKPLDQNILQSPAIRQAQYDYDAGPSEPAARVHEMMSLIEPPPAGFNILPPAHSTKLSEKKDKDWHKLNRTEEDDGTIVVEFAPMRNMQLNDTANFGGGSGFSQINIVAAPEPSTGLIAIGAGAYFALRRRRRSK